MYFGWGMRFARTGPALGVASHLANLFANNEQGWYFDNSDLSTIFQDSAGTIPGAVGMPVGLQLDKSGNGNHRFQATAGSRPILRLNATTGYYYFECDGVNDGMQTNSIDFTGTDKVSLFAGVRKLSDAAFGMITELGSAPATSSFYLLDRNAEGIQLASRGTSPAFVTRASGAAPTSLVITAMADISGDLARISLNNSAYSSVSTDQGTGNYGNHPAYFLRRGGTSLPFNGHEYGNICTGRLTTAAEIAAIEQFLAARTGVTLP